jgi:hypothetical protein
MLLQVAVRDIGQLTDFALADLANEPDPPIAPISDAPGMRPAGPAHHYGHFHADADGMVRATMAAVMAG